MRWFKHLSGALNDDLIFEAVAIFGSDAYMVFFGVKELMSEEFDIHNPGVCRILTKKLTKNLQLSRQKTVRILKHFHQKATEKRFVLKSFTIDIEKDYITITDLKLKELCDGYTEKQLRKLEKKDRTKTGQCPEKVRPQEVELEVEEDKRLKTPLRDSSESTPKGNGKFYISKKGRKLQGEVLEKYEKFWDVFHAGHVKKDKAKAADAFLKAINLDKFERILHGAGCEAEARRLLRDDQTPIYAQGWLSGRRWEDYEEDSSSLTSDAEARKASEWAEHKKKVGLK